MKNYQNSERSLTLHLCLCIIGWTCFAIFSNIWRACSSPGFLFRALISQTLFRSPVFILANPKIPKCRIVYRLNKNIGGLWIGEDCREFDAVLEKNGNVETAERIVFCGFDLMFRVRTREVRWILNKEFLLK